MIYITECPEERLEEVRDWMIAKDAELFGGGTTGEQRYTYVMHPTVAGDLIECDCELFCFGPDSKTVGKIRNFFESLKEKFPFLGLEGDFCDVEMAIYSEPGSTEVDLWDTGRVEPEYCRICGGAADDAYWSDWTGTVCVCSPECACDATIDYLLTGNDGSIPFGDSGIYVRLDGGARSIMPDVFIPDLPEYADTCRTGTELCG